MDCFEASGDNQNDTGEEEWYVSDLQLAAELGKTLLERNQDLEINLKQQLAVIEEQAQEIQFLSRQSAALKEVNDSRLRIYEQLEVSVTELEKTNQKLLCESSSDKKRIRRLCDSVDILETKCEELQKLVDELKISDRLRKRERNRTVVPLAEEMKPAPSELRRRFSIENGSISSEACSDELEVAKIRSSVSKLTSQLSKEQRKSEELQAQVSLMAEENTNLREQVSLLQEQQERLVFFHQAERLYLACHKCKGSQTDTDSPIVTEVESGEEPKVGPCTLVQLKNGAVAYGSQESLASVGVVVEDKDALQSKMSQRNCISLLSELDAQYRAVIEKYEDLLHTRRQQVGEYYEDLSMTSINSESSTQSSAAARSLSEEFSEASDLSSGFSDSSEKSYVDQEVQTDSNDDASLPAPLDDNPVSTHFKGSPEYKKLFQEIFDILKRPAAIPQATPNVPEPKEKKSKCAKKQRHVKYSPMKHDSSYAPKSSKPFFVVSPQSVIGYPVFKLPGAMTYAEVLEKGSKYGKPLMYKRKP